jgi:hypothetical protein
MVVEAMAARTETVENFMVLVFVWRGDERKEWVGDRRQWMEKVEAM